MGYNGVLESYIELYEEMKLKVVEKVKEEI
jgi:hypothetical protein